MARSRRTADGYEAPETLIEADFSKGMVTDADPATLAHGQVVFSQNFMHDKVVPYKRGASTFKGGAVPANASFITMADFPSVNQRKLLVIGANGVLYALSGSAWSGSFALANLGYLPAMKPTLVPYTSSPGAEMVWGISAGNDLPITWNGGIPAVPFSLPGATGLAPTEGGRYALYYKSRLVLAASTTHENRMWFSPAGGFAEISSAWDLTNSYIDFDHGITGLAALQNVLLVFSRAHVERLTGSTPPQTNGIGGDMAHGPLLGAGGCSSAHSIAYWRDSAIWASPDGVYMSNGASVNILTAEGGIERDWQEQLSGYDEVTSVIAGEVYRDFYIVSAQATTSTSWICHIPSRAWWRITPGDFVWIAANPLTPSELYAVRNTNRVYNLAPYFDPDLSGTDADGSSIAAYLTTRIVNGGQVGLKAFREGRAMYQLASAFNSPTMSLTVTGESDGTTYSITSLPEGVTRDRQEFDISADDQGIQIAVAQTNSCDICKLYGFEIDYRPYPLTRGGAT